MKTNLEFDLEDLEDVIAHSRCMKSLDMAKALFKIKNISKDNWVFNTSEIQSKIQEVFEEYDINLEDLINEK
jgi:hypothetical protein|tara:strand:- start:476 stop:691 length:216 start_codon:yes stop_codon:yes gene_type:complete